MVLVSTGSITLPFQPCYLNFISNEKATRHHVSQYVPGFDHRALAGFEVSGTGGALF